MKTTCQACGAALSPKAMRMCVLPTAPSAQPAISSKRRVHGAVAQLVRRPKRMSGQQDQNLDPSHPASVLRASLGVSFAVWAFICVAATFTFWELYRSTEMPMPFGAYAWAGVEPGF